MYICVLQQVRNIGIAVLAGITVFAGIAVFTSSAVSAGIAVFAGIAIFTGMAVFACLHHLNTITSYIYIHTYHIWPCTAIRCFLFTPHEDSHCSAVIASLEGFYFIGLFV